MDQMISHPGNKVDLIVPVDKDLIDLGRPEVISVNVTDKAKDVLQYCIFYTCIQYAGTK